MTEADVLAMLSMSTEVSNFTFQSSQYWQALQYDQIQVRESEVKELEHLMAIIPCAVKVGFPSKFLILENLTYS